MEEKKKREAVYNPEADKRWLEKDPKNKKKKYRANKKSTAKNFIRNEATLEEIEELQAWLDERRKQLSEAE